MKKIFYLLVLISLFCIVKNKLYANTIVDLTEDQALSLAYEVGKTSCSL